MIIVEGKHNYAKIFTDTPGDKVVRQIQELCDQEFTRGEKIRIMSDCHVGVGSTVGTTMTITDKVVPNIVGVDVGCGVSVAFIKQYKNEIIFEKLDDTIRKHIPNGFDVRPKSERHEYSNLVMIDDVRAPIDKERALNSIGTLGGGNHFIELNQVSDDTVALVIHSGSRNLGKQIASYYQNKAYEELTNNYEEKKELIERLKKEGREKEIQAELNKLKKPKINKQLAYVQGESFKNYLHDIKIAQHFAELNRLAMLDIITKHMNWEVFDYFSTIHNYIDTKHMILRKGAISAQKGERVIIPLNMRDGSIIAIGKGNRDWNYSAPHGSGRLMSRKKARENISLGAFEKEMTGVWSTSVKESTLDEAPMAYKRKEEIFEYAKDTIDIVQVIKPIYNFKAD